MTQLLSFCSQICSRMCARLRFAGNTLDHSHAGSFERGDLLRIVGDESDFTHTHCSEDSRRQFELAMVSLKAESLVGFDGVESLVLKFVGLELGDKSDASTFLLFVKQNSCPGIGDHSQSEFELLSAVTAQRMEDVSREALGMNANQRRRGMNVSHHNSNRSFRAASLRIALIAFESKNAKVAELSRKVSFGALGRLNSRWRVAHLSNYSE